MTEQPVSFTVGVWAGHLENGSYVPRGSVIRAQSRRYSPLAIEVEKTEFGTELAAVAVGEK